MAVVTESNRGQGRHRHSDFLRSLGRPLCRFHTRKSFWGGMFMSSYTTPGYPAPIGQEPPTTIAAPGPQPQPQGGNGFAVASLIFGIIGGSLFGLIFGFLGLSRAAKVGKGK